MRPLNFTVRRRVPVLAFIAFAVAVIVGLIVTLVRAHLSSKGRLIVYLLAALFIPLTALWLFLIRAYHHGALAQYDSVLPHVLAAVVFLALLVAALIRTTGSIRARVVIGALAVALWLEFWFVGSIVVACSTGDCL